MPAPVIVDPGKALAAGWSPQFDFESGFAGCGRSGCGRGRRRGAATGAPAAPVTAGGGRAAAIRRSSETVPTGDFDIEAALEELDPVDGAPR